MPNTIIDNWQDYLSDNVDSVDLINIYNIFKAYADETNKHFRLYFDNSDGYVFIVVEFEDNILFDFNTYTPIENIDVSRFIPLIKSDLADRIIYREIPQEIIDIMSNEINSLYEPDQLREETTNFENMMRGVIEENVEENFEISSRENFGIFNLDKLIQILQNYAADNNVKFDLDIGNKRVRAIIGNEIISEITDIIEYYNYTDILIRDLRNYILNLIHARQLTQHTFDKMVNEIYEIYDIDIEKMYNNLYNQNYGYNDISFLWYIREFVDTIISEFEGLARDNSDIKFSKSSYSKIVWRMFIKYMIYLLDRGLEYLDISYSYDENNKLNLFNNTLTDVNNLLNVFDSNEVLLEFFKFYIYNILDITKHDADDFIYGNENPYINEVFRDLDRLIDYIKALYKHIDNNEVDFDLVLEEIKNNYIKDINTSNYNTYFEYVLSALMNYIKGNGKSPFVEDRREEFLSDFVNY